MEQIIKFYGPEDPYFEFANFYESPILLDGQEWPTVEHYFQAQKTNDPEWREKIRTAETPALTKKLAWEIPDYDDDYWLPAREGVMDKAVRAKFEQHEDLRQLLLDTGGALLIEDAPDDDFWGLVDGEGQNKMGRLLMKIRDELRDASTLS